MKRSVHTLMSRNPRVNMILPILQPASRRPDASRKDCVRSPRAVTFSSAREQEARARLDRRLSNPPSRSQPPAKECPRMPGETDLHKTLKKEACRWLFRMGYRCIAAEVRLRPLGIIDAVGTGVFRAYHNYLFIPRELPQACFIECKASRADFLRDTSEDGQLTF